MKMKVAKIKANPKNPRTITANQFEKLKKSIQDFPEMLNLVPLVVDEKGMVLNGNMRLKALKELGIEEVEVIKARDLTPEQKKEFIIKANLPFGAWDHDELANSWNTADLISWGMEVADFNKELNVSFKATEKTGLKLKVVFENGEQARRVTDLLDELGIIGYKIS